MTTGRPGSEAVAANLHLDPQAQGRDGAFETSKPAPSGTPLPTRPHFLVLPNSSTNWGPNGSIYTLGSNHHI